MSLAYGAPQRTVKRKKEQKRQKKMRIKNADSNVPQVTAFQPMAAVCLVPQLRF